MDIKIQSTTPQPTVKYPTRNYELGYRLDLVRLKCQKSIKIMSSPIK